MFIIDPTSLTELRVKTEMADLGDCCVRLVSGPRVHIQQGGAQLSCRIVPANQGIDAKACLQTEAQTRLYKADVSDYVGRFFTLDQVCD